MTLDSETLERILLDRSVGELSPDVEALLFAFLADNPQMAQMAKQADQTANMAHRALRLDHADKVADLPPPAFLHKRSTRKRRRLLPALQTLAVAAVIVMAFWLGRQTTPQPLHRPTLVQSRVDQHLETPVDSQGGFWSVARLQRAYSSRPSSNHRMIQWPAPLRRPRFGGQS